MHIFINILFFIFFVLINLAKSCEEFSRVKNVVNLKIYGNGLHRKIQTSVHVMAKTRFSQCRLLYRFDVPRTMFIDDNQLNKTLVNHELITFRQFDTEKTARESKSQKMYFIRKKMFLSTFEMKDDLVFPIFMRYPPAGNSRFHNTTLSNPELAIDCINNQFNKCSKFAIHPDDRLKSLSQNWITIDLPKKTTKIVFQGAQITEKDDIYKVYFGILCLTLVYSIYQFIS